MIPYKNEILETYKDFPRLKIKDLMFGDVVNMNCGHVYNWPPSALLEKIAITADAPPIRGIVPYQKHIYQGSPYIYSSHSVVHMFVGKFFEVTFPVGRYFSIPDESKLSPHRIYIITRYKDAYIKTAEERKMFYDVFNRFNGQLYDIGQLLDIMICELLGIGMAENLPIFGFSKDLSVCSVCARLAWMSWYKNYAIPNELNVKIPGGITHIERTPPALFENPIRNGNTFEIVGVLDGGLLA